MKKIPIALDKQDATREKKNRKRAEKFSLLWKGKWGRKKYYIFPPTNTSKEEENRISNATINTTTQWTKIDRPTHKKWRGDAQPYLEHSLAIYVSPDAHLLAARDMCNESDRALCASQVAAIEFCISSQLEFTPIIKYFIIIGEKFAWNCSLEWVIRCWGVTATPHQIYCKGKRTDKVKLNVSGIVKWKTCFDWEWSGVSCTIPPRPQITN